MRLPQYDWKELERVAQHVVERCRRSLPDEIRPQAESIPVLTKRWHPNAPHIDPEAMYMLGEYMRFGEDPSLDESGVILIYLGAIAWYCEDEGLDFADEVRTTYLHELGHHLGWDESDVDQRGL